MGKVTAETQTANVLFSALSNERNRLVLEHLRSAPDRSMTFTGLAEHIAHQENEPAEQVATHLHHASLPKLADAGLVDYDPWSNVVQMNTDAMTELLHITN